MVTTPSIKSTLLPLDKTVEIVSKIILVVMWGLTIYTMIKLPATIPIHFNANGQADNFGNKATILILPILPTIMYLGLTMLNRYPQVYNYMTKINEDNSQYQYTIVIRMLRFMNLVILLIFTWIILLTYLTTIDVTSGLGFWFLPVTLVLLSIPIIITISLLLKKKSNIT